MLRAGPARGLGLRDRGGRGLAPDRPGGRDPGPPDPPGDPGTAAEDRAPSGASRYAPENTLPALEQAIRLGADLVEFDIRTTRDSWHVLLHDGTLNRTTDGKGPVRDRTGSEVARLDAVSWFGRPFRGTPVPSLDAFPATAGRRVELYVDARDIAPEALLDALNRHGVADRAVVYQSVEYLEKLRAIAPGIRRMPPLRDPTKLDAAIERVKLHAFDTQWSILSKELIDRCHARGVRVFSDALGLHETIAAYRRAIRDGIDVIQTDLPLRVLRALELENAGKSAPNQGPSGPSTASSSPRDAPIGVRF